MNLANRHTIILMQSSPNRATRTFMDYDSISQAMDALTTQFRRFYHMTGCGSNNGCFSTSRDWLQKNGDSLNVYNWSLTIVNPQYSSTSLANMDFQTAYTATWTDTLHENTQVHTTMQTYIYRANV
ncbi:hypothetical protein C4D60_Mb04t05810 [Musa balbisiana]|uniref:Uncharacterized protein n=1 Tax=Musa balbisiana TaxID=52838 RepID=A0A4S8K9X6_MUSBA|nr:hypothetical protein C4D60_Mb04t05810 [Musa balbisiana]